MRLGCADLVVAALANGRDAVVTPARQGLWPASSYWGTRNRQPTRVPVSLAAWGDRPIAVAHYRRIKPDSGNQLPHCVNDTGVVAGWGGPRFLVPQYEGGDPSGCCAATTLNSHLTLNLVDQKASP
jgi:hypothetical protein